MSLNMLVKSMSDIEKPYVKHKTYQLYPSQDDKGINIDNLKGYTITTTFYRETQADADPSRECFVILVVPNRSTSNPPKKNFSVILSTQQSKTDEGFVNKFNNQNNKDLSKSLFEPFVEIVGTTDFLFLMLNKADCLVSEISIQNDYFAGEIKFMQVYVDSSEFPYKDRLSECFKPLCIGISENKIKPESELHYDLKVKPYCDYGSNQPFWELDIYRFYIIARNHRSLSQSTTVSELQVTQESDLKTDNTQTIYQKNEDHKIKDMSQTNVIQIGRGKNKEARDPLKDLQNRRTDRTSHSILSKGINISTNTEACTDTRDPRILLSKDMNKIEIKKSLKSEANSDENLTAPQGPNRVSKPSENFRKVMRDRQKRISDLEFPGYSESARGLIGLININLNSYMNSVLQCLLQAPLLPIYFSDDHHLKEEFGDRKLQLTLTFAGILRIITSHDKTPSIQEKYPQDLLGLLSLMKELVEMRNPDFIGHKQNDAQEFLKILLEGMSEELNRVITKPPSQTLESYYSNTKDSLQDKSDEWFEYALSRENSIITDLFGGQLLKENICGRCKLVKGSFDNFWTLSLSLQRGRHHDYTLQETLEDLLKEESLIDDNFCAKCNKNTTTISKSIIWRLPEILVFHFKRFGRDHDGKSEKIDCKVKYPVSNLDMRQFVKESEDSSTKDSKYTLFGVVTYEETLKNGHYIADCQSLYDKKWYRFDDDYVSESSIKAEDTEISSSPFLLFYVRTSRVNKKSSTLYNRLMST